MRRQQLLIIFITVFHVAFVTALTATELNNRTPRPQNRAVDADGKPLPIPTQFKAALEYQSSEAVTPVITSGSSQKSRQAASQSTPAIADDASCRWLHKRMTNLKNRLQSSSHIDGYLQAELSQYQQQWSCLKCANGGPSSADLSRCRL
ncbi:hypothetical protein [Shewanella dokdonensis]|uniref:Uncharacterized protein n=1 Tax=Shewanella dokdonensis TaxID=712036 RepID=A0ABX8DIR6_9GAMM|nr:hypothetical protein [Shewanella dokdonensis]MCL1075605.1 hypothetical protein [Shewanella dokdonensis]QVK24610.1 hypothetical protein KHX94_09420 [Shewanella dokdonensis]